MPVHRDVSIIYITSDNCKSIIKNYFADIIVRRASACVELVCIESDSRSYSKFLVANFALELHELVVFAAYEKGQYFKI